MDPGEGRGHSESPSAVFCCFVFVHFFFFGELYNQHNMNAIGMLINKALELDI